MGETGNRNQAQGGRGTSRGPPLERARYVAGEELPDGVEADEEAREVWLVRAIREARFPAAAPRLCPRCDSSETIRWGRFKNRQRYKCRSCDRTFSDLTNTPFAHSKRLGLWLRFGECMALGSSVRKTARRVGIDKDTAFRWRHRLAAALDRPRTEEMRGIWAVWDAILPHSYKGRRPPDRASRRKRGRLLDPLRPLHVHVLFLCSDRDPKWEFVTVPAEKIHPTDEGLEEGLGPLLAPHTGLIVPLHRCRTFAAFAYTHRQRLFDPIGRRRSAWALLNRGRRGRIRARGRTLKHLSTGRERRHHWSGTVKGGTARYATSGDSVGGERTRDLRLDEPDSTGESREPAGLDGNELTEETAWALHSRAWGLRQTWKFWMRRFRGVASRYLRSYLAWHRQLLAALQALSHLLPVAPMPRPMEIPGRTARSEAPRSTSGRGVFVPPCRLPTGLAGSVGLDLLLAGVRGELEISGKTQL